MKFTDIPQLPYVGYETCVPWTSIEDNIQRYSNPDRPPVINLDPDYQRVHVWTREQQILYIEYALRGGEVGRNITFNCPGWMNNFKGPYELVDGKQRLEAIRAFLRNEFPVFGTLCMDFEDKIKWDQSINWRVCKLETRKEVLELYLNINAGGTPHTAEEIQRVRELLKQTN
jgi:uncharacterized protein with ParB-like and HNH nuclease domain